MNYPNGRVNILNNTPNSVFNLYDKIPVEQNITSYRNALTGNLEDNMLSKVFFSKGNIILLQKKIIQGVYNNSKGRFQIGYQDEDTLKIIMRSTYLQYAEHKPTQIKEQVARLNKLVWDYVIPTIYKEAVRYLKYMKDQSTLVTPMDLPLHHDRQYKQLEIKPFF